MAERKTVRFFTIFDDPDSQTLEGGRVVYSLLHDLGFCSTKGVWSVRGPREPSHHGGTCEELDWSDVVARVAASRLRNRLSQCDTPHVDA
jgi:hypothetical protein